MATLNGVSKPLYSKDKGLIFPWTTTDAVYNSDGDTVTDLLSNITSQISTISGNVSSSDSSVSDLTSKINGIKYGTSVLTFTDGNASVSTSSIGFSVRPSVIVVSPQSWTGGIRYDFDASSDSTIYFRLWDAGGNSTGVSGNFRFCWVAMQ